jgi:hypothetical protein
MAMGSVFPYGGRRQADAEFVWFDFLGHPDKHSALSPIVISG